MANKISGFTEKELFALQEFRRRVSDVLPNDDFAQRDDSLIRWIRARDMNLDKAEEMIRNSCQWRFENKIDMILEHTVGDLIDKFPYYVDGIDKRGRPVFTLPYGGWDVRTFVETEEEGSEKFALFMNQILEKLLVQIRKRTYENEKNGNDEDESSCVQFVGITDMSGYSFRQLANMKTVHSIIQTVSILEAHYPETMGKMLVINAPAIFSILFGLVKPFMSGRTLDKIQIFSTNKEQWQPAVLEIIEKDQIREQFGGNKI